MDINKLNYFFTAAEIGNFTKAAEKCNIAQTTMSKYISSLEEEMGCKLFVRSNKRCYLTAQGQSLYMEMVTLYDEYNRIIHEIQGHGESKIRMGFNGHYTNVPLVYAFEVEHPDVAIEFTFGEEDNLVSNLKRNKIDAMIVPNHIPGQVEQLPDFEYMDMHEEREWLVCSKRLLDRAGSIEAIICSMPFITKSKDPKYHRYCCVELEKIYGKSFQDVVVAESLSQQLFLINRSSGFALLPKSEVSDKDNIEIFPLEKEFTDSFLLVFDKKNVSEDLKVLIDFIAGQ